MASSFSQTKRKALQQRIADLTQEYGAINQQLRGALSAAERVRLDRQLVETDQQIRQLESELNQLDNTPEGSARLTHKLGTSSGPTWPAIQSTPQLLVGHPIGSYIPLEFVGSGGSGMVFRASHQTMSRQVALKVLYPLEPSHADLYSLFERGLRALGAVSHPHIVQIFECGQTMVAHRKVFYVGMEYVKGVPLDTWSRDIGNAPGAFARRLKASIALTEALAAAHDTAYLDQNGVQIRGVLHGDIKPANVLVTSEDNVKLTDFMLVDVQRLVDPEVRPPRRMTEKKDDKPATERLGTPGFMSRDQETDGVLTTASDVFSLGITLCHLFLPDSTIPPHYMVMSGSANKLPAKLVGLLREMTSEAPGKRPESMHVVAQRLQTLQKTGLDKPSFLSRIGSLIRRGVG